MESQRLSQLIGLIYDAAQDLELWPLLLQGLAEELYSEIGETLPFPQVESIENLGAYVSHWFESQLDVIPAEQGSQQSVHFSGKDNELIKMVLPHLVRALKINRSLLDMSLENNALASILEYLPIGMVVVDIDGRVYAKNRRFDTQLGGDGMLNIRAGRLGSSLQDDNKQLTSMIREVADNSHDEVQSRALRLSGQSSISLMLLPLTSTEDFLTTPKVIIFVASNAAQIEIEPQSLQTIYGLSRAESRLTVALVNGQRLDEISERYHVSKHTLRTQLKAVYAKTDCCRQAELVVKILTSPAILAVHQQEQQLRQIILEDITVDEAEKRNQRMFLSDGRCLSFAEYGADDGYPVVMVHGLTGSRFQVHQEEEILRRHGIRLFIPERPGFGESERLQERRIIDWPTDLEQFLDFLGVRQVALIGYSVGGCFALAAAHQLKDRVSNLTLLSSMGEFKTLSDLDGMIPMFRMILTLGRYTPSIAMSFMRLAVRSMRKNPQRYFNQISENIPQVDKDVLNTPELRASYIYSIYESVRHGERDMLLEQLLIARDWGFSVSEIAMPVRLWHGDLDNYVPLNMARDLQSKLPNANLTVVPGAGHMLLYRIWDEVISSLKEEIGTPIADLRRKM